MYKPVENFYEFIWAKLPTLLGSKISNVSKNDTFAVSFFIHLELQKEQEEDDLKVEESEGQES